MRFIKAIAIIAVGLYLAAFVYVLSVSFNTNIPAHADAILVLGAKVNLDSTPSEPLENRTDEAVKLYKSGKADYIMTTGGLGLGPIAESVISQQLIIQQGISKNKILHESDSHNTFENVKDIKAQADADHIKSVIVVSDRFHIARGALVARHFGFTPVYWDYPSVSYYKKTQLIWNYLREPIAILYYLPKVLNFR